MQSEWGEKFVAKQVEGKEKATIYFAFSFFTFVLCLV